MRISSGMLSNQQIEHVLRCSGLCTLAVAENGQPILYTCEYRLDQTGCNLTFILESAEPGVPLPEFSVETPVVLEFQIRNNNLIQKVFCCACAASRTNYAPAGIVAVAVEIFGREYCLR